MRSRCLFGAFFLSWSSITVRGSEHADSYFLLVKNIYHGFALFPWCFELLISSLQSNVVILGWTNVSVLMVAWYCTRTSQQLGEYCFGLWASVGYWNWEGCNSSSGTGGMSTLSISAAFLSLCPRLIFTCILMLILDIRFILSWGSGFMPMSVLKWRLQSV